MGEESFQEKSEPATPRRRREARKKGQVGRSMELNSFAVLFVGVMILFFSLPLMIDQLTELMRWILQTITTFDLSVNHIPALFGELILRFFVILAPLLIAVLVAGLAINFAQVGFFLTPKPLEPKLDKLDVFKGLKRLVSMRSLVELTKNLIKLTVIGWIAYTAIRAESKHFVTIVDADLLTFLKVTGMAAFHICLKVSIALLVLAILDYAYQRWDFEKQIRMTKQEIKDETKQYEGSPLTKSRVRRVQQELSRMRQSQEIPKADVVITNPTHLAVALKYDTEKMGAPTVIAKGARLFAQKIKKIAREHDVPIVENPPLARAIYQVVEVGMEIPGNLYKAVAEVLAYVFRLKNPGMYAEKEEAGNI